jgi:hypothetical protein
MRSSILSRSVVALATVAIGSVALAAVPATAATPSGITREQVLTATSAARSVNSLETYLAVEPLLRAVVRPSCNIAPDEDPYFDWEPIAVPGQAIDGILIKTYVDGSAERQCVVAAIASNDSAFSLSGTLSLSGVTNANTGDAPDVTVGPISSALSGDVFISSPITVSGDAYVADASFTANGNTTRATPVTKNVKVKDKKSKAEKKAAKKKFSKRLSQAKKNYAKALEKAGSSKNKKAAAKRVYAKARALAKAKYKYATAGYKIVKQTTTLTENRPFNVAVKLYPPS